MTLKEYLKENTPPQINVITLLKSPNKILSIMYTREEYMDKKIMCECLLNCDVDEIRQEDGYVAIWVVRKRGDKNESYKKRWQKSNIRQN